MKIIELITQATQQLSAISDTPRLDVEIILANILQVNRARLLAFPESKLNDSQQIDFNKKINLLRSGWPVAYVIGEQEFWSLSFVVTPDVLIPRADTELLVETILNLINKEKIILADLGTGSGAIAIALQHEKPDWEIHATDKSEKALKIASKNAERLNTGNIFFHLGDWLAALPAKKYFDVIVSNPPYIANNDPHLSDLRLQHEPSSALIAEDNGLQDLKKIIFAAKTRLNVEGCLLLEHGFEQANLVREIFLAAGYADVRSIKDLSQHERVTIGLKI